MKKINVVFDSDVIISALISKNGAGFYLLNQTRTKDCKYIINTSDQQKQELSEVNSDLKTTYKLNLDFYEKVNSIFKLNKFNKINKKFLEYVKDLEDAHLVQTSYMSKSMFLVTYNLKHYFIDKIAKDLSIKVVKPSHFITYLRSL
ncbi:putative toxin-antitoxin system toxin component, PIN family [Candidatus Roizmanbacteria bacterium RIFCSPLOWO2_01_FULL_37_12]|uniref:Putative toxin-antitoxin system toxin component, PIN family n=1 Tax=Candidatus Roizmanbacteria bacterium RIFCSPLOWO2_01_FULL_37_12 TaxID=1802056 RepID=A0A1F7ICH9_9BACT|nr:MAG: putative toxin-antitoxin system toxin component, PIN family [Candidatus Roizmanbacteria bacterium RIFCSPHIGHO2_01_FULL_37_16]OGK26043.1 MAG: putative toxin-antitoxin system toxin component, PIN family [Candidatus Roizmanbacteria bacterium RIFCSPHIGHO2_02_FULL_37_9b]OGK41064.1 MAG: putative toxin-antitoxin system toxin component, PIN family [Candidatus Roizmanbacteria bacterium RIFCSPLOWO2_01_FULL_37_12]